MIGVCDLQVFRCFNMPVLHIVTLKGHIVESPGLFILSHNFLVKRLQFTLFLCPGPSIGAGNIILLDKLWINQCSI